MTTRIEALENVLLPFWRKYHLNRRGYLVKGNMRCQLAQDPEAWFEKVRISVVQAMANASEFNPFEDL